MPNRVIKDSVRQSEQIDSLTWFQEVVFYRLIVTVDDFGRYYANPQIIKSELFPTKEDLAKKDVANALDKLEEVGLIERYEYDGTQYLQFTKWLKHQQRRATKSKFPDCNGNRVISNDIKCNQMISNDIKGNHVKSSEGNGNQMSPYTRSRSNTGSGSRSKHEDGPLADEQEMIFIQGEHDELFEEAKSIGLPMSDRNMSEIVRLYGEYGKDAVIHGIREASRLNKISIAYIETVAKNMGKPKDDGRLDDSFLDTLL